MKYWSLLINLFWLVSPLCGQNNFYDSLSLGTYNVGFTDTVIFNPEVNYDQFGYSGPAPLFVQIWHPTTDVKEQQQLTFGEFSKKEISTELKAVYDALTNYSEAEFIEYNLAYSLPDEAEINYGISSLKEVMNSIKSLQTISRKQKLKVENEFPVIIYHHGAQSISEENYLMAEYFASKGYIFVSPNFHLPYENMPYGAAPFLSDKVYSNDQSSLKLLINFAKLLTKSEQSVFIGHSWGAQSGWGLLHENMITDAFISLETTLEDKTDSALIEERWPELFRIINNDKTNYNFPILMLAGNDQPVPFPFFQNVSAPQMIHASARNYFSHNSFTSVFLMRYFLNDQFPQPDAAVLKAQLQIYQSQLYLIEHFITTALYQKPIEPSKFSEQFYFHKF